MKQPNDRLELGLRWGCGGLVGFAVGFVAALETGDHALYGALAFGLGGSVLCGLAASLFGQKFLDKLFKWLGWLSF